jgi:hypothetical protein
MGFRIPDGKFEWYLKRQIVDRRRGRKTKMGHEEGPGKKSEGVARQNSAHNSDIPSEGLNGSSRCEIVHPFGKEKF